MTPALHFVGFRHPEQGADIRYDVAVRIFGKPDFVHRHWDLRAQQEIASGDIVVFANGTADQALELHSFDDSSVM